MEIDITRFFNEANTPDYSASVAERGQNAGPETWNNAVRDSAEFNFLDDDGKRDAFRAHVKGFGAWDDDEIAAWSPEELNALLIQMISGDMREDGLDASSPDWDEYQEGAEAGRYSGRISRNDDGTIYYYIGD